MNVFWISDTADNHPGQIPLPEGFSRQRFTSGGEAAFALHSRPEEVAVCVVELPLEEETPRETINSIHRANADLPVILIRAGGTAQEAVEVMRSGAYHYFAHYPSDASFRELLGHLKNEREQSFSGGHPAWRRNLVGNSPAMENVARTIGLIAPRRSTVLILGETGTGKEIVARAIHAASPRSGKPLVAINCPAIPSELLESELFGHVRGAFTGALNARVGRFEQAHESTLFIDEIGDLPLDLQAKLLRVLQEREIQPIGSSETIPVDVRVIAATNANLLERVNQGKFREDLYYRLNVVPITLPTLKERLSDIPRLARFFSRKVADQEGIPAKSISPEAMDVLVGYSWPGNVRQLENIIEMAVVMAGERLVLLPSDFNLPNATVRRNLNLQDELIIPIPEFGIDFEQTIARIELNLLNQALQRSKGNKKLAASILGLKRTTLAAKLKSLDAALV